MTIPFDTQWHMKSNRQLALQLAKRDIPALVCGAVNLEGVAMTLPEVQTILDGITVGGHLISDQNMAINQAKTWELLFQWVSQNHFNFDKPTVLSLHAIAVKEEVGSDYSPPAPDQLDARWLEVQTEINQIPDIYERAICAFLHMARAQFFWDVNKRMGRFMMNGILLAHGYPVINVPARAQQEFNTLMLDFYHTGNQAAMNGFLRRCLNERIIQNFKMDLAAR